MLKYAKETKLIVSRKEYKFIPYHDNSGHESLVFS